MCAVITFDGDSHIRVVVNNVLLAYGFSIIRINVYSCEVFFCSSDIRYAGY